MVQQSCDSTGVDYVGDMNATCPITLASLHEIKWPVAFRACPHQPYEAKALITWLQHKQTNPLTNTPVEMWNLSALEVLGPLTNLCNSPATVARFVVVKTWRMGKWCHRVFFGLYTVLLMVTTITSIAARHITETWLCLDASPEKNSSNNQPCSWPYVCTYAAIWSVGFIAYECICIHNRAYSNMRLSLLQTGIQTIYLATNRHPNITTSLSTTWLFYCVSLARFASGVAPMVSPDVSASSRIWPSLTQSSRNRHGFSRHGFGRSPVPQRRTGR